MASAIKKKKGDSPPSSPPSSLDFGDTSSASYNAFNAYQDLYNTSSNSDSSSNCSECDICSVKKEANNTPLSLQQLCTDTLEQSCRVRYQPYYRNCTFSSPQGVVRHHVTMQINKTAVRVCEGCRFDHASQTRHMGYNGCLELFPDRADHCDPEAEHLFAPGHPLCSYRNYSSTDKNSIQED